MSCKLMQHAVQVSQDLSRQLPCAKLVHSNSRPTVDQHYTSMHAVHYQISGIWNTSMTMFASSRCSLTGFKDLFTENYITTSRVLAWDSNSSRQMRQDTLSS